MQDAFSVHDLVIALELFAADAVPPLVRLLVEIVRRRVMDALDERAHAALVRGVGGANELVVRNAKPVPRFAEARGDRVDEGLRFDALRGRGLRDLLSVLVHSDEKVHGTPE